MRESDWTFRLLKWLGRQFGFTAVGWTANPDGVIMEIHFSYPEELEKPAYSIGWPIELDDRDGAQPIDRGFDATGERM